MRVDGVGVSPRDEDSIAVWPLGCDADAPDSQADPSEVADATAEVDRTTADIDVSAAGRTLPRIEFTANATRWVTLCVSGRKSCI